MEKDRKSCKVNTKLDRNGVVIEAMLEMDKELLLKDRKLEKTRTEGLKTLSIYVSSYQPSLNRVLGALGTKPTR